MTILGGGPAGASAALAALAEGAAVDVIERSAFPRHKVCGEFFSPEIEGALAEVGLWAAFQRAEPARIRKMVLHFGQHTKTDTLPRLAWGLSRYVFDQMLLGEAIERGAKVVRESPHPPQVIAGGRHADALPRGRRLFGFKAHFAGPSTDAVELHFFPGGYVGLTPIEGGRTNVCGLAQEDVLSPLGFDYHLLLARERGLKDRTASLRKASDWYSTGPLQFAQRFSTGQDGGLRAGDALSFVDPFTGSGLLAAVKTGILAGRAAARQESPAQYIRACRESLGRPFVAASAMRWVLASGWAGRLAPLVPGRVLFAVTRPKEKSR